jgi:hypothetical protein
MTTFDPDLVPDSEEPNEQDDIIAFHLNGLPRQQARSVHHAIDTNPELHEESAAIAATLRAFPKDEAVPILDAAAFDRQWQALRPTLRPFIPAAVVPGSLFRRWTLPALAGSALVAVTLVLALHHYRGIPAPTTINVATSTSTNTLRVSPAGPPTSSHPHPPSPERPNTFNAGPRATHGALPSFSPAPEIAIAKPLAPIFPAQMPPSWTTANPSSILTPSATAAGITSSPRVSTSVQTPQSVQSSAQPAARPSRSLHALTPHLSPSNELTLGAFGDITDAARTTSTLGTGTSAITESVSQTPGPTIGALGSFRQQFSPWLGYRVAVTYASPSFESTGENIYEFAGTYVVRGPHRGRLATSAEAGAGLVDILVNPNFPTIRSRSFHPAAVVGVGSEFALSKHWGLRAEVRAQLYNSPLINSTSFPAGVTTPAGSLTFKINPIVGVTYRFGGKGTD